MKRILGLDLGIASIGWAIIEFPGSPYNYEKEHEVKILGMGSNIIPSDPHLIKEFQKGGGEDSSRLRRRFRNHRHFIGARAKRYSSLKAFLRDHGMLPENISHDSTSLWSLRASAVSEKLSLKDLGRVLIHLSHKRGHTYHKNFDINISSKGNKQSVILLQDKTELEHFQDLTIGQYYYSQLLYNPNYRIKGQALPRRIHLQEFDAILACQSKFYPDILTSDTIAYIRDKIIFKQSNSRWFNKRIIKKCPFESKRIIQHTNFTTLSNTHNIISGVHVTPVTMEDVTKLANVTHLNGPQVCHKSNPLFQYYRLLVDLSNVYLYHRKTSDFRALTLQEKAILVEYLNNNEFLDLAKIPALLGKDESYKAKRSTPTNSTFNSTLNRKRIKGNQTLVGLKAILGKNYNHLLQFSINYINKELDGDSAIVVSNKITEEPLYLLWRDIFAIKDKEVLAKILKAKYGIKESELINQLCAINYYSSSSFSNISLKAIKKLLPLLINGFSYEEALIRLGYLSASSTSTISRTHSFSSISSSSCSHNPTSNQSLLQLSHIKRGTLQNPVVVKVINKMVSLVKRLLAEYGNFDEIHIEMARELKMSSSQRKSYFLQNLNNETKNEEFSKKIEKSLGIIPSKKKISKLRLWNETDGKCIYCAKEIPMEGYILGSDGQIEHIIPRSLQFNNSLNNQICSCNGCNAAKGDLTGYDFMFSKGAEKLKEYILRVEKLCSKGKISFIKRDNLLTQAFELEDNFITSQLKVSQYISSKALEILSSICSKVIPTKGIITSYLRHVWDYENILSQLNDGLNNSVDVNSGLSKRLDHRHHSIDALVIALTTSDIINKLDRLSHRDLLTEKDLSSKTPDSIVNRSLDKILICTPHPDKESVKSTVEQIIVSHQIGSDKVRHSFRTSTDKRIKTLTPKGSLHRETIYGEIKRMSDREVLKYKVVRVPLDTINTDKLADRVVDPVLRQLIKERLGKAAENPQVLDSPLFSDKSHTQQVRNLRCFSYHQNLTPLRFDENGKALCYVRTDNNHHVGLYQLPNGNIIERVISFLDYAKLRSLGLKGVIMNPKVQWDLIKTGNLKLDKSTEESLPPSNATHIMTLMKNQMYILGLSKERIQKALEIEDYTFLSGHIYRLVAISASNYRFVLHTISEFKLKDFNKTHGRCLLYSSISKFLAVNPTRIYVDNLGRVKLI